MRSMTGYGCGECQQDGFKITVELSSVNRRQSEISVVLPRELEVLEAQIRDVAGRRIGRGRLTARVSLHADEAWKASRIRINRPLARAYARELKRLAADLELGGSVALDLVVRSPGVLQTDEDLVEAEELWPAVEKALQHALDKLVQMREREGAHLKKDLCHRMGLLRKNVVQIRKRAPQVQKRYRQQLLDRLQNTELGSIEIDQERLLKELVLFADRVDISEELARLESHFQQFEECLQSAEPVGRTLDFLAQEMNREINTLGSKANDSLISRNVVALKTELEKFREQAQNLE